MFKIGFADRSSQTEAGMGEVMGQKAAVEPKDSLVQVYFPERRMKLAYYNDSFDLHKGDVVYVDGKLEGMQGLVREVSYNFRIKRSDYHKVIAVVDTKVTGRFSLAGSCLVSFDRASVPWKKVRGWFLAPEGEDEEYASGFDDSSFPLDDLDQMNCSKAVAERGRSYYLDRRVRYLCLDGTHGQAVVMGTKPYQIEFEYRDGQISRLTCDCYCSYPCKHEFAAMLQLEELLEIIEETYAAEYKTSGYFAAVEKETLLDFAFADQEYASIVFE